MKQKMLKSIDSYMPELRALSDDIFDHPEIGFEEVYACKVLTDYLKDKGFKVEIGTGTLPTAFRAEYEQGTGGPVVGFLGEYDALANLGHGCGHHLQTPAAIGAALAIRDNLKDVPYKLVIYGTPAEENKGGKINMVEAGCFKELDMVFSNHTGTHTGGSGTNVALASSVVEWTGINAHAGGSPEKGRSALDAMMLAFHGLECMREHVRTGSRIHYTVMEGTGAANIVHPKAKAWVTMRASDKTYLEDMVRRMLKVIEGSAMMTETQVKVTRNPVFYDTVVNKPLCDASENNARLFGFDDVQHLDEADLQVCGGGATDFGNVSYVCPGILVRAEYNKGVAGHSPEHVALGKTQKATDFIRECAAIMAGVTYDFVTDADFRQAVKDEFKFRLREKGVEA